jgi:oligosaccharide repeat unit polymerase
MSLHKHKVKNLKTIAFLDNVSHLSILFYLSFILSVFCFIVFFITNGGLELIIIQWGSGNRSELVTGNIFSHLLFVLNPVLAGLNQCMYSIKKIKKYQMILLLFYFIVVSMMNGGRGGVFTVIITSVIIYNYVKQSVRLNYLIRYSWLLIFLIPFFTIMANLRSISTVENFVDNPVSILEEDATVLEDNLAKWKDLSRADIQIFIIDHFNRNNFWYGRSFKNLLYGLIPHKYYPDKPAIDDGAYINTLAMGSNVSPNTPSHRLSNFSSWPPRTVGAWYANFGIVGVILAAFIMGNIYMLFYGKIKTNNRFYILLYPIVLLNLHLSILGIINMCLLVISMSILVVVSKIIASMKNNR